MKSETLAQRLVELSAQHLVLRDAVALLLARSISLSNESDNLLKYFSELMDSKIDDDDDATDVRIAEVMRREKDWLVEAATAILRGPCKR